MLFTGHPDLKLCFKFSVKYNVHYSEQKSIPGSQEGIMQSFTAVNVYLLALHFPHLHHNSALFPI